jgi:hypothetical protein
MTDFYPGDKVFVYFLATEKWEKVNYRGKIGDDMCVVVRDAKQWVIPLYCVKKEEETK